MTSSVLGERREIRIRRADRERVAERLHRAMAEGRTSVEEAQERADHRLRGRFGSDLAPVLSDLPGDPLNLSADVLATWSGRRTVLRGGARRDPAAGELERAAALRCSARSGRCCSIPATPSCRCLPSRSSWSSCGVGPATVLRMPPSTSTGWFSSYGSIRSKSRRGRCTAASHFRVYGRPRLVGDGPGPATMPAGRNF
ncbi:DUF1707 domain-containing protein [Pseudonocardia sp. MCCB 268]|nr:DUF1707 domain-containing protein [Pseudonocardia cytotoxica]